MSGIIAQNSGRHTGLVKAASGGGDAVWNLIKTYTASSDSDLSFVDGTDDVDFTAYDEFVFKFIDIHPETDEVNFTFNMSIDSGSNYNVAKTTTFFEAFHREDDASPDFGYMTGKDLAQGTGFQDLVGILGNNNDDNCNGYLYLFNPSSTTFVKHFIARFSGVYRTGLPGSLDQYLAGYGNTTSAVDAVQFAMSSGNIDSGTISLYGIS